MKNIRTAAQLAFRIFIRPVFPLGQWLVFKLGIMSDTTEHQDFHLGNLKEGITIEMARQHMLKQGFFMNRVAYNDPGQVLSMRRLDDELPDRQYHLRIFDDGEVCGHYEYTPEDKPWRHLNDEILEKREEKFAEWIRGIV
jgi:hypothetical protein